MMTLKFLGAAQYVTGSCYLIETGSTTILMECGLRQGGDRRNGKNSKNGSEYQLPEGINAESIDAVILSHAHLDHTGLVPLLVKQGFNGKIYCSTGTHDLLPIMYMDAASLQRSEAERKNRRLLRAGKNPIEPAYDQADVEQTLSKTVAIDYGLKQSLSPEIEVRFNDAGHILGSSIIELWISEGDSRRKLVFSGDLGNCCAPLMRDPTVMDEADILLLESTYGDRNHRPLDQTLDEFRNVIKDATSQGGNILIPAFAVGRTQDLIYWLGLLYREGLLENRKVYIDSPMAIKVSDVYDKHQSLFNSDNPSFREFMKQGWDKWLPVLSYTQSTEDSIALNRISDGAIIIAGSGMCTGGRILHHLKYNLWKKKTHVIFVGFQANGTLGRALVNGASFVKIFGDEIAVKASIHTLGGLSSHAGQDQLLEWAGHFKEQRPRLYLVHGETEAMHALQRRFVHELNWNASIPGLYEEINL